VLEACMLASGTKLGSRSERVYGGLCCGLCCLFLGICWTKAWAPQPLSQYSPPPSLIPIFVDFSSDIVRGLDFLTALRTHDRKVHEPALLGIANSFQLSLCSPPSDLIGISGRLKNFNTIEEFKNSDKTALFDSVAASVRLGPAQCTSCVQLTNQTATSSGPR
jgi:hypothetical protein